MNMTPGWRYIDPKSRPPVPEYQRPIEAPPQAVPPPPPEEQPNILQRAWNGAKEFVQSIPGWVRTAADWVKHKWNDLTKHLTVKSNNSINGVDKRLVHIACAMGIGAHSNCMCTEGMRPRNAGYGAKDSEHIYGNAMDFRLASVPGKTDKQKEQFAADVATVLGYGGRNDKDRLFATVHDGTARHLHIQFGSRNIGGLNPIPSSKGGQADFAAAQQNIIKIVGRDGLERIMQTRMPDEIAQTPPINKYPRYETQQRPEGPRLVYAQTHTQPTAPRPSPAAKPNDQQPDLSGWRYRPST